MNVAIITITNGENYGNRLQNYAVQLQLQKRNLDVETLINMADENINIINDIKKFAKKVMRCTLFYCKYKNEIKRKIYFDNFNTKYIIFSRYRVSNKNIPKELEKKFDLFICGSDQIWNPNYNENAEVNFLQFTIKDKKSSFAASFGGDIIPEGRRNEISKWINELKYISVREESGREMIKELTGRSDAEVLVDPTMLIESEEWEKVCKKPKQLKNNKFILNYFLGEVNKERKSQIEIIAKKNGCEIINLLDKKDPFYQTGPSEFLYLEKNAFLICTDSFHSCVFAILFNNPFIVFEREDNTISMNSRIETLLNKFKLQDKKFKNKITEEQLKCDYSIAYEILEKEKEKANIYLDKILNMNKNNFN